MVKMGSMAQQHKPWEAVREGEQMSKEQKMGQGYFLCSSAGMNMGRVWRHRETMKHEQSTARVPWADFLKSWFLFFDELVLGWCQRGDAGRQAVKNQFRT